MTSHCVVNSTSDRYMAKQGFPYHAGISANTAGAQAICMHLLTIPPSGREKAHLHRDHETAIYVIAGEAELWYGENLQARLIVHAGDFLYIPPDVPHLPINPSPTESCTVVIARTDPNEQESVVLLPQLDGLHQVELTTEVSRSSNGGHNDKDE